MDIVTGKILSKLQAVSAGSHASLELRALLENYGQKERAIIKKCIEQGILDANKLRVEKINEGIVIYLKGVHVTAISLAINLFTEEGKKLLFEYQHKKNFYVRSKEKWWAQIIIDIAALVSFGAFLYNIFKDKK